MRKLKMLSIAAVMMVLGVAGVGCNGPSNANSSRQKALPEVGVVQVLPQTVTLSTTLPGRTAAFQMAEVRPQITGIIQKRLFTEGAAVKAGAVLYQIDPASYEAAYGIAKAEMARAEANRDSVRIREERYRKLVQDMAISRQEYDDTLSALKQSEAAIQATRASLEAARINLAYTRVKAPISGRIGRSSVSTGALVTANQEAALATIHQLDPIYVDVTRSASEILTLKRKLANGQLKKPARNEARVHLILETGDEYPLAGVLEFSEVSVDPTTGSVVLRSVFPNPDQILLPGMFVRARVVEGVAEHVLLVPQQGVSRNAKGEAVALIVDDSDTVTQRILKIDRAMGNSWLVSSGLLPGDRLILEGSQKVRPGQAVTVVVMEPAGAAEKSPAPLAKDLPPTRGGA